jgi:uncharacterized protein (TIGR02996 family)
MDEDDTFQRAIGLNPDDPLRRLVYADWLDERGDPRGEYLRLITRLRELRGEIDPEWQRAVAEPDTRLGDLRLASGRRIRLDELRQFAVYSGLLEGYPNRELNERIISRLLERERERMSGVPTDWGSCVETPRNRCNYKGRINSQTPSFSGVFEDC